MRVQLAAARSIDIAALHVSHADKLKAEIRANIGANDQHLDQVETALFRQVDEYAAERIRRVSNQKARFDEQLDALSDEIDSLVRHKKAPMSDLINALRTRTRSLPGLLKSIVFEGHVLALARDHRQFRLIIREYTGSGE